jgi:soluble lytic murein transglycosylase
MPAGVDPQEALTWFNSAPPQTGVGMQRLAEAMLTSGDVPGGRSALRDAWIHGDFTRAQEQDFLSQHKKFLEPGDYTARLDRLLWEGRRPPAWRMLKRVDKGHRLLGEARLALMKMSQGVDQRIAQVPDELADDPGLWYERVRWRRRKGFTDRAIDLLLDGPETVPYPERVWREQKDLIRAALDLDRMEDAYRLAAHHRQTEAAESAEAEWLAGWIALRFLGDADAAYRHFTDMRSVVQYPISVARASYWAGRAASARGKSDLAALWLARAAEHPTTFYGQLAFAELGRDSLTLPTDPLPNEVLAERLSQHDLVRAARILGRLGETYAMRLFVARLIDSLDQPAEHVLVAALGLESGLPHMTIYAAKRAMRTGSEIYRLAYPMPFDFATNDVPHTSLVYAVSRQESEMDTLAVSPAGARGLMQLMPRTAKHVAKQLKIAYNKQRLTTDPLYNLQLGGAYLQELLDRYDGSYALALAAYNAGPARVNSWIRTYGDPRAPDVDPVDWIEQLPFDETRNYVQRVLESSQVYHNILSGDGRLPGLQLARASLKRTAALAP